MTTTAIQRAFVQRACRPRDARRTGALKPVEVGDLGLDKVTSRQPPRPAFGISLEPGITRLVALSSKSNALQRELFGLTLDHPDQTYPSPDALRTWITTFGRNMRGHPVEYRDLAVLGIAGGEKATDLARQLDLAGDGPRPIIQVDPISAAAFGDYLAALGAGSLSNDQKQAVYLSIAPDGSTHTRALAFGRETAVDGLDDQLAKRAIQNPVRDSSKLAQATLEVVARAGMTGVILGGGALEGDPVFRRTLKQQLKEGSSGIRVLEGRLLDLAAAVGAAHVGWDLVP